MITPTTHMARSATAGYKIRRVILTLRYRFLVSAIQRTPLAGADDAASDVAGDAGKADVRTDGVHAAAGIPRTQFRRWTIEIKPIVNHFQNPFC